MKTIITIAREYGSGGHEVGKRLAKKLGIEFYDKEIISITAERSVLDENFLKENEEKAPSFFIDAGLNGRISPLYFPSAPDSVFVEQAKTIKNIADNKDCIIVGRCADYILKEYNCIKIFLHAPFDVRVERKMALLTEDMNISRSDMIKEVKSIDKKRIKFYEYYSDNKWADPLNYHLSIDVSQVGIDGAVDIIYEYVKHFGKGRFLPD